MQYHTYTPSHLLSKYIKYYWTLENFDDSCLLKKERIFPDGCMELIFHYGDVFKKFSNENHAHIQPRSFIHGQLKQFMEVGSTGRIGVFSIRFMPDGLHSFLPMSVDELTGDAVSVEELWGLKGVILEERIMEATTTLSRIKIIEDFLLHRLNLSNPKYNPIHYCVHSILNSAGDKSVEFLSDEVNIGRRQLERKFIAAVGLSPKLLTRIVRFQNTLQQIEGKGSGSLTNLAYTNGFYDQSHFIKDFKEFTGLNPRQYFASDLEFAKYLAS